jgi:hypothetical protein
MGGVRWPLAVVALLQGVHFACEARPAAVHAFLVDEHTIELGGRTFVAVDAPSERAQARRRSLASVPDLSAEHQPEHLTPLSSEWWLYLVCAISCVVCAAFAAGLTMGLVALDPMQLQITLHMDLNDCSSAKERANLERDQACAERVYPIIENHHLLLVTLLLVNAGANEALPIFLDALLPSWAAILVSVTVVLIFGEIIPSAIFTGPNQLRIAAALAPLVYALIAIASPVAYPLAVGLDQLLGDSHTQSQFKRQELRAIMKMATEDERRPPRSPRDGGSRRSIWSTGHGGRSTDAVDIHKPSVLLAQMEDGHQVGLGCRRGLGSGCRWGRGLGLLGLGLG